MIVFGASGFPELYEYNTDNKTLSVISSSCSQFMLMDDWIYFINGEKITSSKITVPKNIYKMKVGEYKPMLLYSGGAEILGVCDNLLYFTKIELTPDKSSMVPKGFFCLDWTKNNRVNWSLTDKRWMNVGTYIPKGWYVGVNGNIIPDDEIYNNDDDYDKSDDDNYHDEK